MPFGGRLSPPIALAGAVGRVPVGEHPHIMAHQGARSCTQEMLLSDLFAGVALTWARRNCTEVA